MTFICIFSGYRMIKHFLRERKKRKGEKYFITGELIEHKEHINRRSSNTFQDIYSYTYNGETYLAKGKILRYKKDLLPIGTKTEITIYKNYPNEGILTTLDKSNIFMFIFIMIVMTFFLVCGILETLGIIYIDFPKKY